MSSLKPVTEEQTRTVAAIPTIIVSESSGVVAGEATSSKATPSSSQASGDSSRKKNARGGAKKKERQSSGSSAEGPGKKDAPKNAFPNRLTPPLKKAVLEFLATAGKNPLQYVKIIETGLHIGTGQLNMPLLKAELLEKLTPIVQAEGKTIDKVDLDRWLKHGAFSKMLKKLEDANTFNFPGPSSNAGGANSPAEAVKESDLGDSANPSQIVVCEDKATIPLPPPLPPVKVLAKPKHNGGGDKKSDVEKDGGGVSQDEKKADKSSNASTSGVLKIFDPLAPEPGAEKPTKAEPLSKGAQAEGRVLPAVDPNFRKFCEEARNQLRAIRIGIDGIMGAGYRTDSSLDIFRQFFNAVDAYFTNHLEPRANPA